jgi:hypothetical protein
MGTRRLIVVLAVALVAMSWPGAGPARAGDKNLFTTEFNLQDCTFTTTGRNPFFVLMPGHRLVLEGVEDRAAIEVQITVLPDEQSITLPGIGQIMTRVVEEQESEDGVVVEISRNFYAICEQTNSVFYFGEDVDIFEPGEPVSHGGAWRAGVNGAMPGLFMPGDFLLGSRYFQEIAPAVAMDRAEHVAMGLTATVPAGTFLGVVKVKETSTLESGKESKLYAPGVGVIVDDVVKLVEVFDPGN